MHRQTIFTACTLIAVGTLIALNPGSVEAQKKSTPIEDVNRPGGEPYHASYQVALTGNSSGVSGPAPEVIPADKRLVVEFVSARVTVPLGQQGFVALNDGIAGAGYVYSIPVTAEEATPQFQTFVGNQLVRLYVDGNGFNGPTVQCRRNSTAGTTYCDVSISGYLIDK